MSELTWVLTACSLLFVGAGALGYLGVARSWVTTFWPSPRWIFAMLWLGLAALLTTIALPAPDRPAVALLLGVPALLLWLVGLVSLAWMPRWLLPRWFVRRRDAIDDAVLSVDQPHV